MNEAATKKKLTSGAKLDLEIMRVVISHENANMYQSICPNGKGIYSTDLRDMFLIKGVNNLKPSRNMLNEHLKKLVKSGRINQQEVMPGVVWYYMECNTKPLPKKA